MYLRTIQELNEQWKAYLKEEQLVSLLESRIVQLYFEDNSRTVGHGDDLYSSCEFYYQVLFEIDDKQYQFEVAAIEDMFEPWLINGKHEVENEFINSIGQHIYFFLFNRNLFNLDDASPTELFPRDVAFKK